MEALRQLVRRTLRHTMLLVVVLAGFVAIAAPWLLLVFGQNYADAGAPLLRILAAGQPANVLVVLGIAVARIEHRGRTVLGALALQAVLVVGLSAVLLPGTGIEAVGIAWVVSQTTVGAVLWRGILRPLLRGQTRLIS
jgi:O-antigen/teichoic acid export membrane protein